MELVEFLMQKQEKDLKLITKIKWSVIDMTIDEVIECERNHKLYPEYHEEIAEHLKVGGNS